MRIQRRIIPDPVPRQERPRVLDILVGVYGEVHTHRWKLRCLRVSAHSSPSRRHFLASDWASWRYSGVILHVQRGVIANTENPLLPLVCCPGSAPECRVRHASCGAEESPEANQQRPPLMAPGASDVTATDECHEVTSSPWYEAIRSFPFETQEAKSCKFFELSRSYNNNPRRSILFSYATNENLDNTSKTTMSMPLWGMACRRLARCGPI